MAGKSPVRARDDEKAALEALASGADRAEADRARAILLTLAGWTSGRIAEAFGVRQDDGAAMAQRFSSAAGSRLSRRASLRVRSRSRRRPRFGVAGTCLISAGRRSAQLDPGPPGRGDRQPRRRDDLKIAAVESSAPKRGSAFAVRATRWKGRQGQRRRRTASACGSNCARRRPRLADIVLLFADESEALTLSLSRPRMGQTRRGFARASARTGQEGRDDGLARLRPAQARRHLGAPSAVLTSSTIFGSLTISTARSPARPLSRSFSCSTTVRSMSAKPCTPRWPNAPTGSPSNGCPNTRPNSMTSKSSGGDLKARHLAHQTFTIQRPRPDDPPRRRRPKLRAQPHSVGQPTNLCLDR